MKSNIYLTTERHACLQVGSNTETRITMRDSRLTNWRTGKNLSIEKLKNP